MNSEITPQSEKKNRVSTIGVVAIKDGKALLVREGEGSGHITGMYGIPSGRVEPGELEIDAAVREFSEETGLVAVKEDFVEFPNNYYEASIPRKDGTIADFAWRVFRVKNFSGELRGNQDVTPQWVDINDLPKMHEEGKLLPNILAAVQALMSTN